MISIGVTTLTLFIVFAMTSLAYRWWAINQSNYQAKKHREKSDDIKKQDLGLVTEAVREMLAGASYAQMSQGLAAKRIEIFEESPASPKSAWTDDHVDRHLKDTLESANKKVESSIRQFAVIALLLTILLTSVIDAAIYNQISKPNTSLNPIGSTDISEFNPSSEEWIDVADDQFDDAPSSFVNSTDDEKQGANQ